MRPKASPKSRPAPEKAPATEGKTEKAKIVMSDLCPFLTQAQENLLREELAQFSEFEIEKFFAICTATGFNPYLRQIYATGRREKDRNDQYVTRLIPIVSIEGLRSLAEDSHEYEGQTPPQWCNKDGQWKDVWLSDSSAPYAAKVGVKRKNFPEPLYSVARYDSFVQTKSIGNGKTVPTSFWTKAPDNQLLKCAEAGALRKAFPQKLGGLYLAEEIRHDDEEPTAPVEDDKPKGQPVEEVAAPEKPKTPIKPVAAEKKPPVENPPAKEQEDPLFAEKQPEAKPKAPAKPKREITEKQVDELLAGSREHVIECIHHDEFRGKKVGDLSVEQLERLKSHWVDKKSGQWKDTPEDKKKRVEAAAIVVVLTDKKNS